MLPAVLAVVVGGVPVVVAFANRPRGVVAALPLWAFPTAPDSGIDV